MRIAVVVSSNPSVPVDGVRDYSELLATELRTRGCAVRVLVVPGASPASIRAIARSCRRKRGFDWTILQYSQLAWSKRGFPLGALAIAATVRLGGTRLAITIHDPLPFGGSRARDRIRAYVQLRVMRSLVLLAHRTFVTVDPSVIPWVTGRMRDACSFVPVGSNVGIGERDRTDSSVPTVVVFGITENSVAEATRIAHVARTARLSLPNLQLCVLGRGAEQSLPLLRRELDSFDVRLAVYGVLNPQEVATHLASASALLFLRGGASSRRGTIVAAIASGTPIVAERGPETAPPVTEAGLELVPLGADAAAAAAIVRIIEDRGWSAQLSARSRQAYAQWFSWETIGTRILEALQ